MKLSKEQWFESAWYWATKDADPSGWPVWEARNEATRSVKTPDDDDNRFLLYSQFCLEKAGL